MLRRPLALTVVASSALLFGLLAPVAAEAAPAPSATAPASARSHDVWVVSLGDSYISGEAGRWAGNESLTTDDIDALGRSAYWDAGDHESIPRCHRSESAAIHIGVVKSLNLACSGAITTTKFDSDGNFKPGIDFYRDGNREGQALMLEDFAKDHTVKMVALSIGGNDFRFAAIMERCIKDFLVPVLTPHCRDDATVNAYLSDEAAAKVRDDIRGAILRVAKAMEKAGYEDSDWTLVMQKYPRPLPRSASMRYSSSGYERQAMGGCGFRDGDLDWAADTALPLINSTVGKAVSDARAERPTLQVTTLDTSMAFHQRTLCHKAVWRVQERGTFGGLKGPKDWRAPDAVDQSEWVMEVNVVNAGQTDQQESLHPNYWGQLALRNCYRQVWNDGDVRGGACVRDYDGGLNGRGEPNMRLAAGG